jgi:hypothetical protein
MHGQVPLARRNTLAEPRRLIAGGATVGLAIMLILILDGLWIGITRGHDISGSCRRRPVRTPVSHTGCSHAVTAAR